MLAQNITFDDAVNLVLTSYVCNTSQCETKIKCRGTRGFEIQRVDNINVTGLEFSGCGGNQTHGGALFVNNITSLSILNCRFIGNGVSRVRAQGGAIYINTAFSVSIHSSYFINNSAQCNYYMHQSCDPVSSMGGAIFISDIRKSVLIKNCHFEQNRAHTHGGAIASTNTTLVVVYSIFVDNQVHSDTIGLGGAIYAEHSDLTISSNQYSNNVAEMDGGAVSVSESLLSISDSHFTNNIAHRAGGAVAVEGESSFASFDSYFINNNAAPFGGAVYIFQSSLAEATSYYSNNTADNGGAVYVEEGIMFSSDDYYTKNTGNVGGSIALLNSAMSSNNSHHIENSATNGGAIYINGGSLFISNDNYT